MIIAILAAVVGMVLVLVAIGCGISVRNKSRAKLSQTTVAAVDGTGGHHDEVSAMSSDMHDIPRRNCSVKKSSVRTAPSSRRSSAGKSSVYGTPLMGSMGTPSVTASTTDTPQTIIIELSDEDQPVICPELEHLVNKSRHKSRRNHGKRKTNKMTKEEIDRMITLFEADKNNTIL